MSVSASRAGSVSGSGRRPRKRPVAGDAGRCRGLASLYGPRSRMPDAAGLGRRVWDHVRSRAGDMPAQFTPQTRDDVTGWLWEGPFATLIREAIPGIASTDLRRAREYLNACGMVV